MPKGRPNPPRLDAVIETERLVLRAYRDDDRAPMATIHADPRVGEWLGGTLDRAASDAWIDRVSAHITTYGFGFWAAERKSDGRLLGAIGLQYLAQGFPLAPGVEIGWRLAPDAWGHGYATEGAKAALAWGFSRLNLGDIVAFTAEGNARSQAVMARIGMRRAPERDFDHPRLPVGHPLRRHVVWVAERERP